MKKLLSLLMAFSLALVPMLSFADESSGATQNIYNMLLEELTAANLSMTPYDDINRIYLGYMLEKNALGTMEEMVDYITELANGETPENVFAMWYADSSAE